MNTSKILTISCKTNGRCFYCNNRGEVIDHFISKQKWKDWCLDDTPIKGGLDKIENLFLSCWSCNSKKGTKCPEDFMENSFQCWDQHDRANGGVALYAIQN